MLKNNYNNPFIYNNYLNTKKKELKFKGIPKNILTLENTITKGELPKVAFSWSGGKDSALALHEILKSKKYNVISLFTTISDKFKRVSLSGIREDLLDEQAKSIGIPLQKVVLKGDSYEEYFSKLEETFLNYKKEGVDIIAYGDINNNLKDFEDPNNLSVQRAKHLNSLGLKVLYPLIMDTTESIKKFINSGFKSVIVCINPDKLDESFAGEIIDKDFLKKVPKGVDPSGEYGEFHSFAIDGPIFKEKVNFIKGKIQKWGHNLFCDLLPVDKSKSNVA
jgi:uncharacterized protein (TIGR00290 family)